MMEKLKNFLNSLPVDEQKKFSAMCGTSVGYLRKAITKKAKLGPILSVKIEIHSHGAVARKDLHPSEWKDIWPELLASQSPQRAQPSEQEINNAA